MKKIELLLAMMILISLSIYACAPFVSLPKDLQIISPDPNLPPEIKAFSGKWSGSWSSFYNTGWTPSAQLYTVLMVEKIEKEEAIVVYCWGNTPEWKITSGWYRYKAIVSQRDGKMFLSFTSGIKGSFDFFIQDGKLIGSITSPPSSIIMKRLP